MSYERGIKAINLEKTDIVPQMEMLEHPNFVAEITGMDPYKNPSEAFSEAYKKIDADVVLSLPSSSTKFSSYSEIVHDREGHVRTQWGVDYGALWESDLGFKTLDEMFAYDPFEFTRGDYSVILEANPNDSVEKMAEDFWTAYSRRRDLMGDSAVVPGANANALFHYFVTTYGWELTCIALKERPDDFRRLIDRYAEMSIKIFTAWSLLDIPFFQSHDDIAMNTGPIFAPDWYREYIFPWYKEIWKPIKEKGIKILFFSDGDLMLLLDDIFEAGADGVVLEPMNDLKVVLEKWGGRKMIMGNFDTRIITFGSKEEIETEVKRCLDLGRKYPGYFLSAAGAIPHNVPLENVLYYFDCCKNLR